MLFYALLIQQAVMRRRKPITPDMAARGMICQLEINYRRENGYGKNQNNPL
ncbi:MAG: hypothetical protein WBH09_03760 [Rugosibacter sp.]